MAAPTVVQLREWCIVSKLRAGFLAPEAQGRHLSGLAFGHPEFHNGAFIRTSAIAETAETLVLTISGRSYQLLDIDPEYEAAFPNARQRLFGQCPQAPPSETPPS